MYLIIHFNVNFSALLQFCEQEKKYLTLPNLTDGLKSNILNDLYSRAILSFSRFIPINFETNLTLEKLTSDRQLQRCLPSHIMELVQSAKKYTQSIFMSWLFKMIHRHFMKGLYYYLFTVNIKEPPLSCNVYILVSTCTLFFLFVPQ